MKKQFLFGALIAVAILTAGASATYAARTNGNVLYVFNGRMIADAGSGSTVAVDVNGGNRLALKKLVGQSDSANFAVDANTQYLRWAHGVPTVVTESNLVAGDRVSVHVLADRHASLAQIEATAARRVADSGQAGRFPTQPLWLFRGTLDAPAAGGKVTLHIRDGNLRALRGMLGQPQMVTDTGNYRSWQYRFGDDLDHDEFSHALLFRKADGKLVSVSRSYSPERKVDELFPAAETKTYSYPSEGAAQFSIRVRPLSGGRLLMAMGVSEPGQTTGQVVLMRESELRYFYEWLDQRLTRP